MAIEEHTTWWAGPRGTRRPFRLLWIQRKRLLLTTENAHAGYGPAEARLGGTCPLKLPVWLAFWSLVPISPFPIAEMRKILGNESLRVLSAGSGMGFLMWCLERGESCSVGAGHFFGLSQERGSQDLILQVGVFTFHANTASCGQSLKWQMISAVWYIYRQHFLPTLQTAVEKSLGWRAFSWLQARMGSPVTVAGCLWE